MHAGPKDVNREAELRAPSRVACSDFVDLMAPASLSDILSQFVDHSLASTPVNSTCIRIGHLFGKYLNYLLCYLVIRWLIFKTSRSLLGWSRGTAAHHWLWLWLSIRYGMLRTHNEVYAPAQARRANGVRLVTETPSRRCVH